MNHGPLRVAYRPRPQTKKDDSNHDACSVREPRVIICIIFLLVSGTDWYMLHAEYMEICGSIRDVVRTVGRVRYATPLLFTPVRQSFIATTPLSS